METTETKANGIAMLGLRGKLDATTSPQLQEKLLGAIAGGEKHFAIDCAQSVAQVYACCSWSPNNCVP